MNKKFVLLCGFLLFSLIIPFNLNSAEIVPDEINIVKAKVLEVEAGDTQRIPGLDVETPTQTITAQILEGERKDEEVTFTNDFLQLKKGDIFYLNHTIQAGDGWEF